MQYQISHISPQGHAKEMAMSFKRIFPSSTPVVDLAKTFFHRWEYSFDWVRIPGRRGRTLS